MSAKLHVHVIQHVPFEGPAAIETWVNDRGHNLSVTKLYQGETLPDQYDFDLLIVMGGPMSVHDIEQHPWLIEEQKYILDSIKSGKRMLGICLGAQLIAAVLGARIIKNDQREIGWFEIIRSQQTSETIFSNSWPESIKVFHWHGETFELPKGAQLLASSDACVNQGFILDDRIVGLQFHLEVTTKAVASLIENCHDELDGSAYVQSPNELVSAESCFTEINQLLSVILGRMEESIINI